MADETSPESDARASESFDVQDADAAEIRDTDIQFDCPQCGKSLVIDYRGAGLESSVHIQKPPAGHRRRGLVLAGQKLAAHEGIGLTPAGGHHP